MISVFEPFREIFVENDQEGHEDYHNYPSNANADYESRFGFWKYKYHFYYVSATIYEVTSDKHTHIICWYDVVFIL